MYRSVAIAYRIFSLAASQSPIWLPHRTNCTSQIATACISLEYSALPPTRDGFSVVLENEASTQRLCHMITACQGSHAARNAPPAPPPLSATHGEARWPPSNSICGQRRGHLLEHVFHHFRRYPTVTLSQRGVKSFIRSNILLFFFSNLFFCVKHSVMGYIRKVSNILKTLNRVFPSTLWRPFMLQRKKKKKDEVA